MVGRVLDVPTAPSGTVLDDGKVVVELYVSGVEENGTVLIKNMNLLGAANFLLRRDRFFVRIFPITEEKEAIVLKIGETVLEGPLSIIRFARNGEGVSPIPRYLRASRDFGHCPRFDREVRPAMHDRYSRIRRN